MSMKKSLLLVVTVIVLVTVFQLTMSGGNAMLIDMSDTAISFSGTGNSIKTLHDTKEQCVLF